MRLVQWTAAKSTLCRVSIVSVIVLLHSSPFAAGFLHVGKSWKSLQIWLDCQEVRERKFVISVS